MEINLIIAENMARLRADQNLSLGQLSERSGVSKVLLSQIEKGISNPTINTIWKIAAGLRVPYSALLDQNSEDIQIVRKKDLMPQTELDGRYRVYYLFPYNVSQQTDWFEVEMEPGTEHDSSGHTGNSEEFSFVTAGTLTLVINGEEHMLSCGDGIHFVASVPHRYINRGSEMVRFLTANQYPLKK
ncbi:MAG: helix-turn-helix domain-containing protein [Enterocloster sp.]